MCAVWGLNGCGTAKTDVHGHGSTDPAYVSLPFTRTVGTGGDSIECTGEMGDRLKTRSDPGTPGQGTQAATRYDGNKGDDIRKGPPGKKGQNGIGTRECRGHMQM